MKRDLVRKALAHQLSQLSVTELEKVVGVELEGKEDHVAGMMIHYVSEDQALAMSEEEMNDFLVNLD